LNAIFLPAVIGFNQAAESMRRENKLARMAYAMGLADAADIGPAIKAMSGRLGLPAGLSELGVNRDMFPKIIDGALADHSHNTNPRSASRQDYFDILEASL
jgi:alcohol dehydrogenase class IV